MAFAKDKLLCSLDNQLLGSEILDAIFKIVYLVVLVLDEVMLDAQFIIYGVQHITAFTFTFVSYYKFDAVIKFLFAQLALAYFAFLSAAENLQLFNFDIDVLALLKLWGKSHLERLAPAV